MNTVKGKCPVCQQILRIAYTNSKKETKKFAKRYGMERLIVEIDDYHNIPSTCECTCDFLGKAKEKIINLYGK